MQAIVTKYLCPTNHHGARISVSAQAGRKVVPWDHAIDAPDNHAAAAAMYIRSMNWGPLDLWRGGQLPDGTYAWVCADETIGDRMSTIRQRRG